MSAAFVLDASMALAWAFADEATAETAAVLDRMDDEIAAVPFHWFLEVSNALVIACQRHRLADDEPAECIALLQSFQLDVDVETASRAFTHVLPLAQHHQLTTYDAAYLDLAVRRRLPLATLDAELRSAATKAGVNLVGVSA